MILLVVLLFDQTPLHGSCQNLAPIAMAGTFHHLFRDGIYSGKMPFYRGIYITHTIYLQKYVCIYRYYNLDMCVEKICKGGSLHDE